LSMRPSTVFHVRSL